MNARGLRLLIVALLAAMLLGAGGMARASAHDHGRDDGVPRGTFKVDDSDFDDLPANTPHVVCGFRVAMLRPVAERLLVVFVAKTPTERAQGTQDLLRIEIPGGAVGSQLVDLTALLGGIQAHPQQGFHIDVVLVRFFGDDAHFFHKVIWFRDCRAATTSTTAPKTTTTTAKGTTPTTSVSTTSTLLPTGGSTSQNGGTQVPTQVLGERFVQPSAQAANAAGATALANTGSPFPPALGIGLAAIGLLLFVAVRRPTLVLLPLRTRRRRHR